MLPEFFLPAYLAADQEEKEQIRIIAGDYWEEQGKHQLAKNCRSDRCSQTFVGHSEAVTSCAWSPDGSRIFSGSNDKTLKVWDVVSCDCLHTLLGCGGRVLTCDWSPDGSRVLSVVEDRGLKVWDATSWLDRSSVYSVEYRVNSSLCAWSPDGIRVLTTYRGWMWDEDRLVIWDLTTRKKHAYERQIIAWPAHTGPILDCAWSPNGSRVLSASQDSTLKVWDVTQVFPNAAERTYRNRRSQHVLDLLTLKGHKSGVKSCSWSPDGSKILSASSDKTLKIWDAVSGCCLLTLAGHKYEINACAWSPDGTKVLSASADQTVKIWDIDSACCLLALTGFRSEVFDCSWSPDGSRVLAASLNKTFHVFWV